MDEKVLTVIVPAYNVSEFLGKCLESFCIPESQEMLEVLVIDDGSTDRSGEIADSYIKRYPEIFRLHKKENGGHGSAINSGIRLARGKYVKVVDGDDWLEKKELKGFLEYLKNSDCDIVATEYIWVDSESGRRKAAPSCAFQGVRYEKIYKFEEIKEKIYLKMHNMTVLTELFRENCPPLDEFCFYVDNEFILYPAPFVKTVTFLKSNLYMYRIGRDTQSVDIRKMQERVDQHRKVLFRLLEYFQKMEQEGRLGTAREYMADGIGRMAASQIKIYLSFQPSVQHKQEIRELDQMLLKNYPDIYFAVKNQAVCLLRKSRYWLYWPASVFLRTKLGID